MVEDYLSDRDQEEALRRWWQENWRWIISGVALGLVALFGWQYWQKHEQLQAENAALNYREFTVALNGNDRSKADTLVQELDKNFAKSPYVDQAHLMLAQAKVAAGEFEQAASDLKIVSERSGDKALQQIARLRLARVQIQLGHHDDALGLLDVSKAGAFAAQVQEIRGDALMAKGDKAGARAAYQAALESVRPDERADTALLQLKLQDLVPAPVVNDVKPSAK